MTNREAFATAMALLTGAFDRKLTESARDGYWAALDDLTPAEFSKGTKLALRESKFMPTPAELREFALGKDWKARQESRRLVAETDRKLKQLEAQPATAEEIARSRRELGLVVKQLAESKDAGKVLGDGTP